VERIALLTARRHFLLRETIGHDAPCIGAFVASPGGAVTRPVGAPYRKQADPEFMLFVLILQTTLFSV
jgi:hypothetical protein